MLLRLHACRNSLYPERRVARSNDSVYYVTCKRYGVYTFLVIIASDVLIGQQRANYYVQA